MKDYTYQIKMDSFKNPHPHLIRNLHRVAMVSGKRIIIQSNGRVAGCPNLHLLDSTGT